MDETVRAAISDLGSTDDEIRFAALQTLLTLTENRVDWVYAVWNDLVEKLNDQNSYQRSIAIMLLCNLAKSDFENRFDALLPLLLAHTKDEKFVTSRQCLQAIWKVAAASEAVRKQVLDHLEFRYRECLDEKHYNLIRQDIIQSIRCLYEADKDPVTITLAQTLIGEEKADKYRKKYAAVLQ